MRTTKFTQLKISKRQRRKLFRGIFHVLTFLCAAIITEAQITVEFQHTGAEQTWVVPSGITSIDIEAWGASGGAGIEFNSYGGQGGKAQGTLSVTPGATLYIYVGGEGKRVNTLVPSGGGFNGGGNARGTDGAIHRGGGGGGTDLRTNGNGFSNRVIVAGGGGGSCSLNSPGGNAGGNFGIGGDTPAGPNGPGTGFCDNGAFGIGGSSDLTHVCPGGGGGWYGGGSGCSNGGGGGSGYVGGVTNGSMNTGVNFGNGKMEITYTQPGPLANDFCPNATPLVCGDIVQGNTTDAGLDNPPACNSTNGTTGGLWYSFVGTGELVNFSTCNSVTNFNTKISIYTGLCDELICIAGNNDAAGCNGASEIEIQTIDGAFYYILINGDAYEEGDFQLEVTCPIPNEECPGAELVNCGITVNGSIIGFGYGSNGTSLWYKLIGNDECVQLTTCRATTTVNTIISVYTGDCNNPNLVAENDDNPDCGFTTQGSSLVEFFAEYGVEYLIKVSAAMMHSGNFSLAIQCNLRAPLHVSCPNDIDLPCDGDIPAAAQTIAEFFDIHGYIGGGSCLTLDYENFTISSNDIDEGTACDGIRIERVYTITSIESGEVETCTQLINIAASPEPELQCGSTQYVDCVDDILSNLIYPQVVSSCHDNLEIIPVGPQLVSGTPNCPGTTYFIDFQTVDSCGRYNFCYQLFEISDSALIIECQEPVSFACFEDFDPIANAPIVNTNCSNGFTVNNSEPRLVNGDANCSGATYQVAYFVTDDCGRTASCTQLFTIQNEAPQITCTPGFTVACAENIVVNISDATVITSCDLGYNVEITGPKILIGGPNCPGTTYNYYYVVKDDCGRQSMCTRTFTIENDGPSITCQAGGNIACIEDIPLDPSLVSAVSSCGKTLQVRVQNPQLISGVAGCNGAQYEVVYFATDNCGRTASCTAQYFIVNEGPQIIESASDQIVECSDDITPQPELIIATTDCGLGMQTTYSEPELISGDGPCDGEYEIVYTVADDCGRTAEVSQYFIIQNEAPRVIPPDPITISCLAELDAINVNDAEMYAACNIPIVKTEIIWPSIDKNEPLCNGDIINVLYSATDACGRMTCEPQIIFIQLDETTLANQLPNVTVDCSEIPAAENVEYLCGFKYLSYTDVEETLTSDSYQILRTYTAEDGCDQSFEHTQVISVNCGVSTSNKESCTLDVKGWTDADQISANDKFASIKLSHADPIIIGSKGHRVLFTDFNCLQYLLSAEGEASTFKHFEPELYVHGLNDGGHDILNTNDYGFLQNTLFSNMIALELNIRADKSLKELLLKDICLDWNPALLEVLGEVPTIKDLAILGNQALATEMAVEYDMLLNAIEDLLAFFMNCRVATCNESGLQDYIEPGTLPIALSDFSLRLYPNPSTDFININLDDRKGQYTIHVFDAVGQVIYQNELGEKIALKIDARKWNTGMYHVGLTLNGVLIQSEQLFITRD